MKKRTLVCFLIFTLCVFHYSIPDTAFGQDATPEELAQQVFDEHNQVLRRADVKQYLPEVIEGLKGDLPPGFTPASVISFAVSSIKTDPTGTGLKAAAAIAGLTLTDDHIAIIADADVQAVLEADNTQALLSLTGDDLVAGLDKLLELINAADAIDPGDVTKPDPAPPTIPTITPDPTTPQRGSFNVFFTTADVNNDNVTVTGSISVVPSEAANYYRIPSGTLTSPVRITQTAPTTAMPTIPGATVTLTLVANDGTADSASKTVTVQFAQVEIPTEPPDKPPEPPTDIELTPSDLNGQSRLGGLSLNKIYARGFIEKLITDAGLPRDIVDLADAVDLVLNQIPDGFLPKAQIRYALTAEKPLSVFQNEPPQLDSENFGNAISPALTDLLYTNVIPEKRYLANDNMNVYVRVPNALKNGSVQFRLSGSPAVQGKRISPTEFQADTIPYTFELEETLAATNLPAWPAVDPQDFPKIFKEVVLRYSQEGLDGEYISLDMDPYDEDKGVVWKGDVGIIPGRNVFYYFEVTLVEPVMLNILNPIALGEAIISPDGTHDEVATKEYRIESWAMPDPRNLQFQDRGIIDALITPDVAIEIARIYLLSQGGNQIPFSEFNKLTQYLGRNAEGLLTEFEGNFDPRLASVFTVPHIDYDTESLWVANFDAIPDGDYTLGAVVRNADGEPVDHIEVDFIGDSSAPEADITFTPIANADVDTSGYLNKDSIFVSTDKDSGPAALLDIGSVLTKGILGRDDGYLLYQVSGLDKDGNPITTWLPLTVESSMLTSDLWDIAKEQLQGNPLLANLPEQYKQLVDSLWSLPFNSILGLITPGLIQELGNPELAKLGIRPINDARAKFIVDLLGALVADIDAIPLTFNEDRVMRMVFPEGEYGIRALGIDNLLNISSHIGATRLRIVKPEYDRSSITLASLGDLNGDGDADEPYESGTIFSNAKDVTLAITVDERSGAENHGIAHPGTITVQYENADGEWVTIGDPIILVEGENHPEGFKHHWNVSDFDDLVAAGEYVRVRTVTSNKLDLTTTTPEADYIMIKLDGDVHPVDPKVLVVDVNESSIVMTNPDSGAPQGMIELIAYTPRRTYPETTSILIEVMRKSDDEPIIIKTVQMGDAQDGTATAAIMFNGKALSEIYPSDTSMIHIDETSSYLKWTITVDTKMLPDSIEASDVFDRDKLAAAHAASNPNGESYETLDMNRYSVRGTPIVDGELPDNPNENPIAEGETYTDMFSVDNVDDVSPLGQNIITVSQDNVQVTPNEDGSFDVGGLVDKYDPNVDSPVITLTIKPSAKRDTYDTVHLFTSLPEGAIIDDVTENPDVSGEFSVTVDVGTLMDSTGLEMEPDGYVHNDRYLEDTYHANPDEFVYNPKGKVFSFTAYALTEDAAEKRQGMDAFLNPDEILNADLSRTTAHEITVNVTNTYRPDPGVLAITVENSDGMVNPDSKAPKYELTFNAYTYGHTSPSLSSPPTGAVRFEVKRLGDETWERIIGTVESEMVTDADLDDTTTGLTQILQHNVLTGGASAVAIPALMKYSVTIDTREFGLLSRTDEPIKLGDTIKRGDAAECDVALDGNQYRVRAIALTPQNIDHPEYPQVDGVDAHFSLDNVDDVPPVGPTLITKVSDVAGLLAESDENGIYSEVITVGGIVDPGVQSPVAIFTIEPTAEMITYEGGQIRLVQTQKAPDGTVIAVSELPPVDLAEGKITVDVGLLPDGEYEYYALVGDAVEPTNWQVQGEVCKTAEGEIGGPSPVVKIRVLNISVRDIVRDDVIVRKSNITDLTVTAVDGESPDRLPLHETVGELPGRFPLKDSIAVSFGVDNGSLAVEDLTGVLINGQPVTFEPDGEGNAFSLMASDLMAVADGWYTPLAEVTKRNGSVTFPLATINLDNTGPTITIITPTEGATVSDLPTLSAEFSDGDFGSKVSDGEGVSAEDTAVVSLVRIHQPEIEGVLQDLQEESINVNQKMVEQNLDSVVYTRIDQLAGGAYQFTVSVQDRLGNSEPVSVIFAIEGSHPIVVLNGSSIAGQTLDQSPKEITGFFAGGGDTEITKFTVYDAQGKEFYNADEAALEAMNAQDGNIFTYTPDEPLVDGFYKVAAQVTDGSELTADASFTFTVKLPVPAVAIVTPIADQVNNDGMPTITGEFSGATSANNPIEVKLLIDGDEVTPIVNDKNQVTHTPASDPDYKVTVTKQFTYTPTTALDDGPHKATVIVTDANGRTAETSTEFIVDIPGPTVMIHVPDAGQIYDISKPVFQGEFSGVATPVTLSLTLDDKPVEADKGDSTSAKVGNNTYTYTPFTYTPANPLDDKEYTLVAVATDANGKTDKATVIFSVSLPVPTVAVTTPAAGQVYSHGMPIITGTFSGADKVADKVDVKVTVDKKVVDDAEVAVTGNNEFSYTPKVALGNGPHNVSVVVTDANKRTAMTSVDFEVNIPGPSVAINAPAAGQVFDHGMPKITVESSGVAKPVDVVVTINGEEAVMNEDGTYSPAKPLGDDDYTVVATATDANKKPAEATVIFSVEIPGPSIVIHGPAAGQMFDHGMPKITVESSGVAKPVDVVVTVDGEEAVMNEDGTYSPAKPLGDGDYTVVATATDANKKPAEATVIFSVSLPVPTVAVATPAAGQVYSHGMPIITGTFSGADKVDVKVTVDKKVVDDAEVAVTGNNEFSYTPKVALGNGPHNVSVVVTDANKRTAMTSVDFEVNIPGPSVAINAPAAGQVFDHGMPKITVESSGVAKPVDVVVTVDGKEAVMNDDGTYSPTGALLHGEHTVVATATDANKKTAEATVIFTVDIPGPAVVIHSPGSGQNYTHDDTVIRIEYSGTDVKVTTFTIDGENVEVPEGNPFTYNAKDLGEGEHTVAVEVTDLNGKTADATAVYNVEFPEASVTLLSPLGGHTFSHGKPIISGEYIGVGDVTVVLTVDGAVVPTEMVGENGFAAIPPELAHGDHVILVTVTDANRETAQTGATFTVDIPGPSVAIHSPGSGQNYSHDDTVIRIEYSGTDAKVTTFTIDGENVEVPEGNPFTYNAKDLGEGEHTVAVEVTDGNGKTADATAVYNVEFPEASVTLLSPLGGHTFNHGKPIISGEYTGVGDVTVVLTVDGAAVATEKVGENGFAATSPELAHGDHTVLVTVTDANKETAQTGATFTVDIPGPSVAIIKPAPGQTFDHGEPVIRVEYSGTEVGVTTFTINGNDVEGIEPQDNAFEYTPNLVDGEYTVVVEVTDENDKTAKASTVFVVAMDTTPPVISEVSPSGVLKLSASDVLDEKFGVTIAAIITDEQSDIISIEYAINQNTALVPSGDEDYQAYPVDRADGKFEVSESFNLGTHQISLRVQSEGGLREFRWHFTLEADTSAPTISSITPSGTIHAGMPTISASAVDNSGVSDMTIVVIDSDGEEVAGETTDDAADVRLNQGVTRIDFHPEAPLSEGTYSIEVRATDTYNNSSTASGVFTVDFDTAAPIITSSSPQNGARLMYKYNEVAKPTISITFGDAETGVNVDSIRLSLEGPGVDQVINLSDDQKSASQVVYTPEGLKEPGQYTVILEVSDNANLQGNVSEESEGAREANLTVHKFSFFVEYSDAPVLLAPFNFPNPFADNTRISFGLNQMSVVSIVIYDSTLRPVRVLVDNKLMPAGKHTGGNGIGWDGTTSSGEKLARGIYYCQIVVTGSFESEYAILKLALTGAK